MVFAMSILPPVRVGTLGHSFHIQCPIEFLVKWLSTFQFPTGCPLLLYRSPSLSLSPDAQRMDNYAIVDSACLLTAVAYSIVLFRIILRRLKHEKLEPDDYIILFALIFYTITTASYPIIVSVSRVSRDVAEPY